MLKLLKIREVTKVSRLTGKTHTMTLAINDQDYADWQKGKYIQDAMPYLDADQREFLITGATAEEWEEAFGEEAEA